MSDKYSSELSEIAKELFFQGYYEGRDDEYAQGKAVAVAQAITRLESLLRRVEVEALKSLLKNGNDKMPGGTQRINSKTGRVEFMEEHQIIHDWQINDRIRELEAEL